MADQETDPSPSDVGKGGKGDTEVLSATAYYEKGNKYYEQGDYDRAIENYNMGIILNPSFLESYFNRALCYYNKKNYDKSIEDYSRGMEIDPDNPLIYNNRGDAYYRKQEFDSAIADYDKAISLKEDYLKAFYNRGLAYASLQDYETAIENFSKVVEIDENFSEAYNARGLANELLEKYDESIEDYEKAVELNPDFTEAKDHLKTVQEKQSQGGSGGGEGGKDGGVSAVKFMEIPDTNFSDIVGMNNVKELIKEYIVYPLQDPELARKYGKLGGGGVILYGPPGCGKTYIMKAAAGEVGAKFLNVKLSDVLDMYVGNTEKNIRNLFEAARKNAPTIMFIDEIDGLGGKREDAKESAQYMKMAVNQLLYEMDGVESRNENVLVVAATNSPWDVDTALRRAGRFTKMIYVGEPDARARTELFKFHSSGRPLAKRIDWGRLSRATYAYSASDIKAVCDDAASVPWLEALKKGKQRNIRMSDYIAALEPAAADPFGVLIRSNKKKGRKSTLPPWYESAKKQVGRQEEIETVDGKEHKRIKAPKMAPGEREYFRELIGLIERRNKPWYKMGSWAWRKFALYQDYILMPLIGFVLAFIYLIYIITTGSNLVFTF